MSKKQLQPGRAEAALGAFVRDGGACPSVKALTRDAVKPFRSPGGMKQTRPATKPFSPAREDTRKQTTSRFQP